MHFSHKHNSIDVEGQVVVSYKQNMHGQTKLRAPMQTSGGRLGKRLAARINLLPHSHHHRFPALEQVGL
jgi:hypothetical protein